MYVYIHTCIYIYIYIHICIYVYVYVYIYIYISIYIYIYIYIYIWQTSGSQIRMLLVEFPGELRVFGRISALESEGGGLRGSRPSRGLSCFRRRFCRTILVLLFCVVGLFRNCVVFVLHLRNSFIFLLFIVYIVYIPIGICLFLLCLYLCCISELCCIPIVSCCICVASPESSSDPLACLAPIPSTSLLLDIINVFCMHT